jgi:hypothetical protein
MLKWRICCRSEKARSAVVVDGAITAHEMVATFLSRSLKAHHLLRHAAFWSNALTERDCVKCHAAGRREGGD